MTDTVAAYDEHAKAWASRHGTPGYWKEGHRWLLAELPPPARIIEFGSGTGRDALDFIRDGYEYTGTDASSGFLEIARKNVPQARLWKMNLLEATLPDDEELFDGFWTVATLLHIPKTQVPGVLRNISAMVRPDAPGFITLKAGTGEGEEVTPEVPSPRFFAYWEETEFGAALSEAGFRVIRYELRKGSTSWHQFLVRR